MPFIERNGRTVHYTVQGDGPGVVLVPGLGSGARLFGTLPRRFARHGFTCAAVDPVGLSPSSPLGPSGYDFDEAARDVLAVAEALPGATSLVGTSLGGKVSLRAASVAADQVHRLVMLCSSAVSSARSRRVYRMFELLATAVDPAPFAEIVAPMLFGSTFLEQRRDVVDDILRASRPTDETRELMASQARALQHFDGDVDARRCRVSTLCLAGAEDTLTQPDEVRATSARIPTSRCEVIAGAGHSLLLESTTAFDRVLQHLAP